MQNALEPAFSLKEKSSRVVRNRPEPCTRTGRLRAPDQSRFASLSVRRPFRARNQMLPRYGPGTEESAAAVNRSRCHADPGQCGKSSAAQAHDTVIYRSGPTIRRLDPARLPQRRTTGGRHGCLAPTAAARARSAERSSRSSPCGVQVFTAPRPRSDYCSGWGVPD